MDLFFLRIQVVVFALVLITSGLCYADNEEKTRKQLQQLKTKISQLQKELKNSKDKLSKEREALRQNEISISNLAKEIKQTNAAIKKHQQQISQNKTKKQNLEKARADQELELAKQIRSAYRIGRQEYLKLILNQEDPYKLTRVVKYYDYFNQSRVERIEKYEKTIGELEKIVAAIEQEQTELANKKITLEDRSKKIKTKQSERNEIISQLNAKIKNQGSSINKLTLDRKQLEKVLAAINMAIEDLPTPKNVGPFSKRKGKLVWPVNGKIIHHFGSSQEQGQLRWNGAVIQAKMGTKISAIHHGRVVFADWLQSYGLLLIIEHGDGYMSLYAHNQTLLKETGEWVNAGDAIATVGNSGGQEKSGLYFEIRYNGKPTDPLKWCVARK